MESDTTTPIAVIGMSFQLPGGATSSDSLWSMMLEKRCASSEFPEDRLGGSAIHHKDRSRGDSVPLKGGHFIEQELGAFDAPFFSISASEAEAMDPQSRSLLETTYRALENAGESMEAVSNSKTSVYTGNLSDDYKFVFAQDIEQNSKYGMVGMTGLLAGRLSWFFNLKGPSMTVDTACSSSLVALDLGCQSLLASSSNMAIVTGCSLLFAPNFFHMLSNMGMLSPDSRSYSFDHRANGYGRGEGIVALVLKRLPDALRDNNTVRAVIRSTGVNYDGRTPGVTQPNGASQLSLIRETYKKAGLSMSPTRYFEAHGTGTPVGDVIETSAIGAAFQETRSLDDPLYIGSVKSNIGHAEGASGLASVIKAILTLENGMIPPNANFELLNPKIAADQLKIKVAEHATHWPTDGLRRVSVNSFGASGTNAHAIIDDAFHYLHQHNLVGNHCTRKDSAPTVPAVTNGINGLNGLSGLNGHSVLNGLNGHNGHNGHNGFEELVEHETLPRLIMLTAFDKPALQRVLDLHNQWIEKNKSSIKSDPEFLQNLAYTLLQRRSLLRYRTFAVVDEEDILQAGSNRFSSPIRAMSQPRVGFVFTGQGAQWAGMGRDLMRFSLFHESVKKADAYLKELGVDWDVIDVLENGNHKWGLDHPVLSQTLCTVLQIALCDLWRALHVRPSVVVGHSSGEIAAAYCAGAISWKAAIRLAYSRGVQASEASQKLSGGMMAVAMAAAEIEPLLKEVARLGKSLTIACVNSPLNVTISGDKGQLEELAILLEQREVFHRRLRVDVAYHSPIMGSASAAYKRDVGVLEPGSIDTATETAPDAIMISSVTRKVIDATALRRPEYWAQNMMQPVLFSDAMSRLWSPDDATVGKEPADNVPASLAVDILVEIGPHSALESPIREIIKSHPPATNTQYYSSMKRNAPAHRHFLATLGHLACHGVNIDFDLTNSISVAPRSSGNGRISRRVVENLPEYPFDHSCTYLPTGRLGKSFRFRRHAKLDLLGKPVVDWNPLQPRWRNFLKLSELPWVKDHKINDTIIYPAVGVLIMAIEAANQLADPARPIKGFKITDTYFMVALAIPDSAQGIETQLILSPTPGSSEKNTTSWKFRLFSHDGTQWQEHSHGTVHIDYVRRANDLEGDEDLGKLQRAQVAYDTVDASAIFRRTKDEFYDSAFNSGYTFGPTFRAMDNLAYSDRPSRRAIASISPFEWREVENRNHFQEHVVHPVTLDGILQTSIAAFIRAGEDVDSTAVPAEIEYIYVSKNGLNHQNVDLVKSVGTFISRGNVGYETSVVALDNALSRVTLEATGIKMRFVTGVAPAQDQAQQPQMCYGIEWKPDIDMLKSNTHRPSTNVLKQTPQSGEPLQGAKMLLAGFLDLLTFKKPDMKILHLTGSEGDAENEKILQDLFDTEQQGANSIFPCMELVSSPSMPQATNSDTYDLVVYSGGSMLDDLEKIRGYLLPNGKLAMILQDQPQGRHSNVNGIDDESNGNHLFAPGVDSRHNTVREEFMDLAGFGLSLSECKLALEKAGFDNILHSTTGSTNVSTLLTASNAHDEIVPRRPMNYVLVLEATPFQDEVAKTLRSELDSAGLTCTTCYIDQLTKPGEEDLSQVLIFISELERPLLQSPSPAEFSKIRDALVSTKGLLWLTVADEGGILPPDRGLVDGFTRVLRSENAQAVIVTASVTPAPITVQAKQILSLIQATDFAATDQEYEASYRHVDGIAQIGRLRPMMDLSQTIFDNKSSNSQTKVLPFRDAPPVRLAVGTPGLLDSLYFEQDVTTEEPLPHGWVEIRVTAVGLNFKDLLLALGRENGTTFGNECAGVIHRTGEGTSFQKGDMVCLFTSTAFSTYTRAKAEHVARVPKGVSLTHAAAVPTQFVTAWYAIYTAARAQKGETMLIHSAAGGTGQAALQIAQMLGCKVFATVGSEEKKRFLIENYGIPDDHIFYSRNTTFAQGILRLTEGRGVDVIINSLSGDELLASWDIIAPHGRFIELGKKDIAANNSLPMRPFLRRATFTALEIGAMAADFGALGVDIINQVLAMFVKGCLRPVENFQVLPISQIKEGMRALQSGQSMGKIVFDMADDAPVPVRIRSQSPWQLDATKTYVIAGGTSGLGLMIAEWMVKQKGARYLLLLSRSGIKQDAVETATTIDNMRALGAVIEVPKCDISDINVLRDVVEAYRGSMPHIAGCIQSSMVLKDSVLANMSHEDWAASTKPKVSGSWNLHMVLPKGLDFFILLSSISGVVGSAGQANYAAANTYMDALAHYRHALGDRAVALDLGAMLDHGVLATNEALRDRILRAGLFRGVSSSELLALLDHFCGPAGAVAGPHTAQVAIGLAPASELKAASPQTPSSLLSLPFYRHVFADAAASTEHSSGEDSIQARRRQDFVSAKSTGDAGVIVSEVLLQRLITMTPGLRDRLDANQLDEAMQTFGVDSLQAIELRSWFAQEFAADVPIFVILGDETLASIGLVVAGKSKLRAT